MRGVTGNRLFFGVLAVCFVLYWVAPGVFSRLLERYLVIEQPLKQADALVLMAGSLRDRLPAVVHLYQKGMGSKILLANDGILAGWSQEHQRNLYHVEWARLELLKQGVPGGAIEILPFSASGTIHDARHAVTFARDKGLRSLLAVTSDYHTRRTLLCLRRAAGDDSLSLAVYSAPRDNGADIGYHRFYILTVEFTKNFYYWWRYSPMWE